MLFQNVNVCKNEGESLRRPTPTHATYFWNNLFFFLSLLRLLLFWRVRGRSDRRPLLLSSAAHRYGNIGRAALLLPSDVSHGPHSSCSSQESSNTGYPLATSALVVFLSLCTTSAREEVAGLNLRSDWFTPTPDPR